MLFLYCFFGVLDTAEQMVIENISQWVHIWQKKKKAQLISMDIPKYNSF